VDHDLAEGHDGWQEDDEKRSRFWDSVNGRILLAIVVCIPLTNLLFSPLTCALGWYVIESHQLLQPTNPNFWRVVLGLHPLSVMSFPAWTFIRRHCISPRPFGTCC
jgi:hypothetical protein